MRQDQVDRAPWAHRPGECGVAEHAAVELDTAGGELELQLAG
jgi:hypothetical protein